MRSNSFAVRFDDNGLVLTLMKSDQVSYPKTFHIGFIQVSEEHVDEIEQHLKDDGLAFQALFNFYDLILVKIHRAKMAIVATVEPGVL